MRTKRLLAATAIGTVLTSVVPESSYAANATVIPETWYTLSTDSEETLCGASADFINGIRLSVANVDGNWFLSISHSGWQFLSDSIYNVRSSIDGQLFSDQMKAITEDTLMVHVNYAGLKMFAVGNTLTLYSSSGAVLAVLSLSYTDKVVKAISQCTLWLEARSARQPFGPPTETPSVPFAQKRFSSNGTERGA